MSLDGRKAAHQCGFSSGWMLRFRNACTVLHRADEIVTTSGTRSSGACQMIAGNLRQYRWPPIVDVS
jgi:hypothetical protein